MLGFGASKDAPRALGLFAADLALVYAFDDTDVQALASIGPLGGAVVDGAAVLPAVGLAAGLGLRFPVAEGVRLEARVALPEVLWTPAGTQAPGQLVYADGATAVAFPFQASFAFGLVIDFAALFSELR